MRRIRPYLFLSLSAVPVIGFGALAQNPQATQVEGERFFLTKVAPILNTQCLACHGDPASSGGKLLLNTRASMLKGGQSGAAIIPGKPDESLIIKAVRHEGPRMPPNGKLTMAQIDVLYEWVKMGAPVPANTKTTVPGDPGKAGEAPHAPILGPKVDAKSKQFWSFQPVKLPAIPKVKNKAWVRNPIDAFVLAKLESNGLQPNPPASKSALLRRVTYDLIGLPPTPEEVKAFLADNSPNAYEKVVDKLLADRRYGERWARHWMDVVRYAETNSFERDDPKPYVWRYRDYLIRSFNEDKPYDRFTQEQLAGDELPDGGNDGLIATGYYRLGTWDDEPSDPQQAFYDDMDDIVSTTAQTWLGLTVNCARCHDHKIDPIPQADYYKFLSFFRNVRRFGVRGGESIAEASLRSIAPPDEQKKFDEELRNYRERMGELNRAIIQIERLVTSKFVPVEKEEFQDEGKRVDLLRKLVPDRLSQADYDKYATAFRDRDRMRRRPPRNMEQALCVTEEGRNCPETNILLRGNPGAKGDVVEPGFLSVLSPPQPKFAGLPANAKTTGRRSALASWIASAENPLTSRVMANRIWHWHFGRGIVRSTSNFGFMGTHPTHPELLDWLAAVFSAPESIEGSSNSKAGFGWKMKPLHRLVLLSNTYRMSSAGNPVALKKDPENDLLWRVDMRRLEAEEIRDSILAVNTSLNTAMFGPSVYPVIPKEVHAGQSIPGNGWPTSNPFDAARRSVYIHIKRSLALPMLVSFDGADTDATCPVRFVTTQPTQALGMMNSKFANDQAKLLADDLKKNAAGSVAKQVELALWRVTQRQPTPREIDRGVKLMAELRAKHGETEDSALQRFCVVALSLNEFLWLD